MIVFVLVMSVITDFKVYKSKSDVKIISIFTLNHLWSEQRFLLCTLEIIIVNGAYFERTIVLLLFVDKKDSVIDVTGLTEKGLQGVLSRRKLTLNRGVSD